MELRTTLLVALFALICSTTAIPVSWESTKCSRTCSQEQEIFGYEVGRTYEFSVDSRTSVHDQDVSLTARALIAVHEPCEYSLTLRDVRLEGSQDAFAAQAALEATSTAFGFDDGRITAVCAATEEPEWTLNVKRAVLSALQMSARSLSGQSLVREEDFLGTCDTDYTVDSTDANSRRIVKRKSLATCTDRQSAVAGLFPTKFAATRGMPALGNAKLECVQEIEDQIMARVTCEESHSVASATKVDSSMRLTLKKTVAGVSAKPSSSARRPLLFAARPEVAPADELKLLGLLREMCVSVSESVSPSAPAQFQQLVRLLRPLSAAAATRVFDAVDRKEVCGSGKLRDLLEDAMAADAGQGSAHVLATRIANNKMSATRADVLLTLLAFNGRPSEGAIRALLPLVQRDDASRQTLLGVSALAHNFCEQSGCQGNPTIEALASALTKHVTQKRDQTRAIVALKALANIERGQDVVARVANDEAREEGVRVAAVGTGLVPENQLLAMFTNEKLPAELRIVALRSLVKRASRETILAVLDQLKRESSQQVGAYATSLLRNLQTSSDPAKRNAHEMLMRERLPERFPKDARRFSRNVELSYFSDALGAGAVVDADLIYAPGAFAPRHVALAVSAPLFGHNFRAVRLEVRQKGLERQIERFVGPRGAFKDVKNFGSLAAQLGRFLQDAQNEVSIRPASPFASKLDLIDERLSTPNQAPHAAATIGADGKTLVYLSLEDTETLNALLPALTRLVQKATDADNAVALQLVDAEVYFPTMSGLPVKLRLNGTFIGGLKSKVNRQEASLSPSFAVEVSASLRVDVPSAAPGLSFRGRLSSGPAIAVRLERTDTSAKLALTLPQDKQTLLAWEARVHVVDKNGVSRDLLADNARTSQKCSREVFTTRVCSEVSLARGRVTLEKKGSRALEVAAQWPASLQQEVSVVSVRVATPDAQEISAEAQLTRPATGDSLAALITVRAPKKQYTASATAKLTNNEREVSTRVEVEAGGKYLLDIGVERDSRARKAEYRPRLRIEFPQQSAPIVLGGSVAISSGKRNAITINLSDANNELLKGSLSREGAMSGDWKVSGEVSAALPVLEMKISGGLDKQQMKTLTGEANVEYSLRRRGNRKHSIRVSTKLQDLSSAALKRGVAFAEVRTTQWPELNWHVDYNVQLKEREHLENELRVRWRNNLDDDSRRIHVLQVARATPTTLEARVSVDVAPIRAKYEVRLVGDAERGERPKFRVEVAAKDVTADKEVKASLAYKHESRKPLRLSMDAKLSYPGRELAYHDQLAEQAQGEFRGKTSVQWQVGKQATMNYAYRVKSDSLKTHHELDYQLDTPSRTSYAAGSALLRATRDTFDARSQMQLQGKEAWNMDLALAKNAASKFEIRALGSQAKLNSDWMSEAKGDKFVDIVLTHPRLTHATNIKREGQQYAAKSNTEVDARKLYSFDAVVAKQRASRLAIDIPSLPMTATMDAQADKFLNFDLRAADMTHKSSVEKGDKVEIRSRTEYRRSPVAVIDAVYHPRQQSYVALETPKVQGRVEYEKKAGSVELKLKNLNLAHKTSIRQDNDFQVDSVTTRDARPLATLKGRVGQQSSLKVKVNNWDSELELDQVARIAKVALNNGQYQHQSEVRLVDNTLKVNSNTHGRGQKIVSLDAELCSSRPSKIEVDAAQWKWNAKAALEPRQRAEIEVQHPRFNHKTQATKNTLQSTTTIDQKQFLALDAKLQNKKPSFFDVKAEKFSGRIDFDGQSKAQLLFDCHKSSSQHKSELDLDNNQFRLQSRTTRRGEPLYVLDANLNKQDDSSVKMEMRDVKAFAKLSPFGRQKRAEIKVTSPRWTHNSEASFDDNNNLFLTSKTDKSGARLVHIDAQHAPQKKSSAAIFVRDSFSALSEFEPRAKNAKLELKGADFEHTSNLAWNRDWTLKANTKQRQQPLADIDAVLANDRRRPSSLNIQSPAFDCQLRVEPTRSAKFELRRQNWEHKSAIDFDQDWKLSSKTDVRGRNLADVDALVARNNGFLKVASPAFDGTLTVAPKTATIQLKHKSSNIEHRTHIDCNDDWKLESRTQRAGQQLASMEAQIADKRRESFVKLAAKEALASVHLVPQKSLKVDLKNELFEHRSTMDWQNDWKLASNTKRQGQEWAQVDAQIADKRRESFVKLAIPTKNAQLEATIIPHQNAKLSFSGRDFAHRTSMDWQNDWKLASNTKRQGQEWAQVNAQIADKRRESFVKLAIPAKDAELEATIVPHQNAKLSFSGRDFSHRSNVDWTKDWKFDSRTDRQGKRVLSVDAVLAPKSHLKINSQVFDGSVLVENRKASLEVKAKNVEHSSEINIADHDVQLKSRTTYDAQPVALLTSKLSTREASSVQLDCTPFSIKSTVDPKERKFDLDFSKKLRSPRRVLLSAALRPQLVLDVAWDADKDPESRLRIQLDGEKISGGWNKPTTVKFSVKAKLGSRFESDLKAQMSDSIVAGPHAVTIDVTFPELGAEPASLELRHSLQDNQLTCLARYSKNGQEQLKAQTSGKLAPGQLTASIKVTSAAYQDLNGMQVVSETNWKKNWQGFEVKTEVRAQASPQRPFVASALLSQQAKSVKGRVALATPLDGWKSQEVNVDADWSNAAKLSANVMSRSGKQLELVATATKQSIDVELASNVARVPSVKVTAEVTKRRAQLALDVEREQKINFDATVDGDLRNNVDSRVTLKSAWTPTLAVVAQGTKESRRATVDLKASIDNNELASLAFKAQKTSDKVWGADIKASIKGAEEFRAEVKRAQEEFTASVTSPRLFRTYKATASASQSQPKAAVCAGTRCFSAHGQFAESRKEIVLRKPDSETRISWTRTDNKQKLEVDINGQKMGYVVEFDGQNGLAQLVLPSRVMESRLQVRGAQMTFDVLPDTRRPENKLRLQVTRQGNDVEIKASCPRWSRPVTAKLVVENRKVTATFDLDPEDNNKEVTIRAWLESTERARNNSLSVQIFRRDRRVDFAAQTHFAQVDDVTSAGLRWTNQRRSGFFFAQASPQGLHYSDSARRHVTGSWIKSSTEVGVTMHVAPDTRISVSAARDQPCAWLRIERSEMKSHVVHACVAATNERLLKVTVESTERATEKEIDAEMTFDTRHGKVLTGRLRWNPDQLGNALVSLGESTDTFKNMVDTEWLNEAHQAVIMRSRDAAVQLKQRVFVPFATLIADESEEILTELAGNFAPVRAAIQAAYEAMPAARQLVRAVRNALPEFPSLPDSWVDAWIFYSRQVSRAAKRACAYDSTCYKMATEFERRGLSGCYKVMASAIQQSFQTAHKFVESTRGALADKMPDFAKMWNNCRYAKKLQQWYKERIARISQRVSQLANNPLIASIVDALKAATNRLNYDWTPIARMARDAAALLADPRTWATHSRMLVYDPEAGEIQFEIRAPFSVHQLRATMNRAQANYNTVGDVFSNARSMVNTAWLPPFKGHALLVGGQQIATFDRKFFALGGRDCAYLLARDTQDGNFSVIAKYGRDGKKTLIVGDVELDTQTGQVKILSTGRDAELPLTQNNGRTIVTRTRDAISVRDSHGLDLICQLSHDVCHVTVSGFYYGRTVGLLGSYDSEPSNDATEGTDFELQGSCRSQTLKSPVQPNSADHDACKDIFAEEYSPLRAAFAVVDPAPFLGMCASHVANSQQSRKKSVCEVAAAYVLSARHAGLELRLPATCAACSDDLPFGAKSKLRGRNEKSADVVFVVEESECARSLLKDMDHVTRTIERELNNDGFHGNHFALVGFSGRHNEAHAHTARGRLLFPAHDMALAAEHVTFSRSHSTPDAFQAIAFALQQIPFRGHASKNVVLVSCSKCEQRDLSYSDLQRALLDAHVTLHVMSPAVLRVAKSDKTLLAVDAESVFRARDLSQRELRGQPELRATTHVPKDICVALAQETHGALFSTQGLTSGFEAKQLKSLLARRLAKTATVAEPVDCFCLPDSSDALAIGRTECRPRFARQPKLPARVSNDFY